MKEVIFIFALVLWKGYIRCFSQKELNSLGEGNISLTLSLRFVAWIIFFKKNKTFLLLCKAEVSFLNDMASS